MEFDEPCKESEPLRDDYIEKSPLLHKRNRWSSSPLMLHSLLFFAQVVFFLSLSRQIHIESCHDPSLELWSPANQIVKYKTVTFEAHFEHRSPYLGTEKALVDTMWEELYDYGTSGIDKFEAAKLLNETLPAPKDADTYLIELQVFHDIHCLNMMRKAIYRESYPDMLEVVNGSINRDTMMARHLDHCIDSLRQTLMCSADVTPVRFHHNLGDPYRIFPAIFATHTCRDYSLIADWAKERQVPAWKLDLEHES